MANVEVAFKIELPAYLTPEGLRLRADGTWKHTPGGWFHAGLGKWIQVSSVGVTMSAKKFPKFALMQKLVFSTVVEGDRGVFRYDARGYVGTWVCVSTIP